MQMSEQTTFSKSYIVTDENQTHIVPCSKCENTGEYKQPGDKPPWQHVSPCDACCTHPDGFSLAVKNEETGVEKWYCNRGCGTLVESGKPKG